MKNKLIFLLFLFMPILAFCQPPKAYLPLSAESLQSATTLGDYSGYGNAGTWTIGTGGNINGKWGTNTAVEFDGATSKIEASSDFFEVGDFSVSLWMYANSAGEVNRGIIFENCDATNGVQFRFDPDYPSGVGNGLYIVVSGAGTSAAWTDIAIVFNQWYHVVLTYDHAPTSIAQIYLNNVEHTASDGVSTMDAGVSNVFIGATAIGSGAFDGIIHDFKYYNYILSEAQRTRLFEIENPVMKITNSLNVGLIAYYSMSSASLNGALMGDGSGHGNNGTITAGTGGSATGWRGDANGAYEFDGADTKIDCASDFVGTTAITVTAWINISSLGENNTGKLIDNGKFQIKTSSSGGVRLRIYSDGATQTRSGVLPLNRWVYIAVTRDATGANTNTYFDGVLTGSANQNSGTPTAGTTNVIIGNNNAQTNTLDGKVQYLRIYNRILSLDEITAIMNTDGANIVLNNSGSNIVPGN